MHIAPDQIDWSLVQLFLAVAEEGSLSGAARRTGQSQPTLGRQMRRLEAQTGLTLFTRRARGLDLTEQGQALLPAAQRMAEAMGHLALVTAGQEDSFAGTVRITASEIVAHGLLPPIIAEIRAAYPQISIELVPSDSSANLLFRESDIAVRMYRSEQLDIVTRKLGDVQMGAFAARRYLDRVGRPRSAEDLRSFDLIGYDRSDLILRGIRQLGFHFERTDFATRCDDQVTYWELLRAGCGIGFGQRARGLDDPLLEEIDLGLQIPSLPLWLAAHESLRRTPRVGVVWDMLAKGLAPFVS